MNRASNFSVAHAVRSRIQRGGADRIWTYVDFPHNDRVAVSAALSRLARAGVIRRVRRGVYYRTKDTVLGPSRPDPETLLDAVLRALRSTSLPTGMSEYSRLGLTTQVSGVLTRAVPRRVSTGFAPGVRVRLSERPLDRQRGIRREERAALDALRDVGRIPDSSAGSVLARLKVLLRSGRLSFERLATYALAEPPRVRALLGALGSDIRDDGRGERVVPSSSLAKLRASLNPLTGFGIRGAREALVHASDWAIK